MFRVIMQSAIMRMCWPLFLHPHIYFSFSLSRVLSDPVQASTNKDGLMARGKCKRVLSQLTEPSVSLFASLMCAVTAHYICWASTCVFMPCKLKHLDFWHVLHIVSVNYAHLNMLFSKWGSWKHPSKMGRKLYIFMNLFIYYEFISSMRNVFI